MIDSDASTSTSVTVQLVAPTDSRKRFWCYGLMAFTATAYVIETFNSNLPGWNHYQRSWPGVVGQHTLFGYIAFVESLVHFKTIQQRLSDLMPSCMRQCWGKMPDWQQLGLIYVALGLGPMIFLELSNDSFPKPMLIFFAMVLCASVPFEWCLGCEEGDHAFHAGAFQTWCNGAYALLHALDEGAALIMVCQLLITGHAVKNKTPLGRSVMGMKIAVDLSWAAFTAHHVFHQHAEGPCEDSNSDHYDHDHVINEPSATFSVLINGVAFAVPMTVIVALILDAGMQLGKGEYPWHVMLLNVYSHLTLLGANRALMVSVLPPRFFSHHRSAQPVGPLAEGLLEQGVGSGSGSGSP